MRANKAEFEEIKHQLANSVVVRHCALQHNVVGDLSAMKVCYLLRHYPNLSVSEIAELVGLSISATSRCLTKLKAAEVVTSNRMAQKVLYQLEDNDFTNQLISQLGDKS